MGMEDNHNFLNLQFGQCVSSLRKSVFSGSSNINVYSLLAEVCK